MADTDKTQSVLDAMTAGIMGKKEAKAAQLTPVGREQGGPLSKAFDAPFPFDYPASQVQQALRNIRQEVDYIIKACDAVEASLSPAGRVPVNPVAFVEADEPVAVISPTGWSCPEHGDASLVTLTSRKGRTYRSCTSCMEFEK